ncbi:50S ribosomal protein L10 [Candidatus Uhrbacteria bacterium]|nr:50S ribosomal protein L10 [Candidatus Uhrbacteria bacterium]
MAKTRSRKEEIVAGLKDHLGRAKSVVVASYNAMSVAQSQELRKQLEAEQAEYVSVKKTLLDVAVKDTGWTVSARSLAGSISLLLGYGDEVAPAKVLMTFRKKNEVINPLGGIFEGRWITAEEVTAVSTLPTKQQLRGQLVGLLNAPISGVVGALNANIRQLVSVIDAIGNSKK